MKDDAYVSDVVLTSDLRGLRPLLEEWVELIKDYCAANQCTDNPWWYGERANLGLLAGAAWRHRNGWHALEEFPTEKRRTRSGKKKIDPVKPDDGVEKKKKSPRGRCDLYVSHKSTGFAIEAKQAWQNLSPGTRKDRFAQAMTQARRDAGNLHADEAAHRVGCVFVVPFISTKALRDPDGGKKAPINAQKAAEMVGEWIEKSQIGEHSGYAYVYTRKCRDYINAKGNLAFPGIILVLSRCKTGARAAKES